MIDSDLIGDRPSIREIKQIGRTNNERNWHLDQDPSYPGYGEEATKRAQDSPGRETDNLSDS